MLLLRLGNSRGQIKICLVLSVVFSIFSCSNMPDRDGERAGCGPQAVKCPVLVSTSAVFVLLLKYLDVYKNRLALEKVT